MFKIIRAVRFLFVGPFILAVLVVINFMTTPGHWWVKWPALGIGIAWVLSVFRVIQALIILGGVAALIAYLRRPSGQTGRPGESGPGVRSESGRL